MLCISEAADGPMSAQTCNGRLFLDGQRMSVTLGSVVVLYALTITGK